VNPSPQEVKTAVLKPKLDLPTQACAAGVGSTGGV
jgi:hypothetical protein